jgi:plasmid stabilization system protein ParE
MIYRIRNIPEARKEIKKAKEWYENQSIGLGDRFADEVKKAIRSLSSSKIDHKLVFANNRRMLLPIFPYAVYYKRDENKYLVTIIAVLHNKQSLDRLLNRLVDEI